MKKIHNTAIISDGAIIGKNAKIGPYSIIGENVIIGDDVEIESHVVIAGKTIIGNNNKFYPFASIGQDPQDLKYDNEESELIIGDKNIFREYVTVNRGTKGGGMKTVLGSNNLFMIGSHIAHDCIIGNNVIMANNSTLAGHVKVDDHVVIGGLSAVHQFVRIGKHAMIGGMSGIDSDIIPYGVAMNERASLEGVNIVGLKRRGFSKESILNVKNVYNYLFFEDIGINFSDRVCEIEKLHSSCPEIMDIVSFLKCGGDRAICRPKNLI